MGKKGLYGNAVAYEKPAGKKTTIGGKKKRYNKSNQQEINPTRREVITNLIKTEAKKLIKTI